MPLLPPSWQRHLGAECAKPYFRDLCQFLADERRQHDVFPPEDQVFTALALTPIETVKVVIFGQDPYHGAGQSHGLAFSVAPGVRVPPSLRNIFQELHDDLGHPPPTSGSLIPWAKQGVLLLNAVLTVRTGEANSHSKRGWETFTDAILEKLNARPDPLAFLLWGTPAQKKRELIGPSHFVIESPHPSPLSARRGFFGSRPFSRINEFLTEKGRGAVDWRLA